MAAVSPEQRSILGADLSCDPPWPGTACAARAARLTLLFKRKACCLRKRRPGTTCRKEKITLKINAAESNNVVKL